MTRVVRAYKIKIISFKNSIIPHIVLFFEGTSIEEIENNRPRIEGVNSNLVKFLGDHKDVQKWEFILRDGKVALLVPKRYVILLIGKIFSIRLLFEEKEHVEA